MNCFVEQMKTRYVLFPAETIVRDSHQHAKSRI